MVDIHQGPPGPAGKAPYIDETTGNWFVWDEQTEQYVDSGESAEGPQGVPGATPDMTIGTVETGDAGSPAEATITGTPEAPVLNLRIPQGAPGVVQAKYIEVQNLPTASASTMDALYLVPSELGTPNVYDVYYTTEVGRETYSWIKLCTTEINLSNYATKAELTQLEAEVHNLSGKYYGIFEDAESLPEGDSVGYAFVGTTAPFAIYNFDGEEWADSGAEVTAIEGEQGPPGVGLDDVDTPTPYDGTVILTLSDGNTITLDLNHNHPEYFSKNLGGAMPVGGFLPDVAYKLGTLSGTITFALASAVTGNLNHYFFTGPCRSLPGTETV